MAFHLVPATAADSQAIAALRNSSAAALTKAYGPGHWSNQATPDGVRRRLETATILLHRRGQLLIAMLALSIRKPAAIDPACFTPLARPLYLTDMAVHPHFQRDGVGRQCLEALPPIVTAWPADGIRLDAYDAPAGAGEFYRKCGFNECGRVRYRGMALVYFECIIRP